MDNHKFKYDNEEWFAIVIGILIVGVLFYKHFVLNLPLGPSIFGDELLYKEKAEQIFNGKGFTSMHYPPLYSLMISIAFFFDDWYNSIQIINGILSSLLVVPIWLVSRMFLSKPKALLVILLVLLLPFQAIYPGYIMSENLFLFIFAFTVYFSLQGVNTKIWKAGLFGLFLALGYLTKYLMLPAIPVLILIWVIVPLLQLENSLKFHNSKHFWINVLIMIFSLLIVLFIWVSIAKTSGFTLIKALGLNYVKGMTSSNRLFSNNGTLQDFLMWGSFYFAYLIFALLPYITLIFFSYPSFSFFKKNIFNTKRFIYLLLISLLTLDYWFVATQHSFRALYNYPVPAKLIARYLMQTFPFLIILGVIFLDRIITYRNWLNKKNSIIAALLLILLMIIAKWILFQKAIWGKSLLFYGSSFCSPFILYNHVMIFRLAILTILVIGLLIIILPKLNKRKAQIVYITIISIIIIWQGFVFYYSSENAKNRISGIHASYLAKVLNRESIKSNKVTLYYSVKLSSSYWENYFKFWNIPKVKWIRVKQDISNVDIDTTASFFLIYDSLPLKSIISYKFRKQNCYLYKLNSQKVNFHPKILEYGPHTIKAGKKFNIQPSGKSAIWVKAESASKYTILYFNNKKLETHVNKNGNIWAPLPIEMFNKKGLIEMYLLDELFKKKSKPVLIKII